MESVKRFHWSYLFFLLFIFFMINRIFFSSSNVADKTFSIILYPFLETKKIISRSSSSFFSYFSSVSTLNSRIKHLEEERDELHGRLSEFDAKEIFLNESSELLKFNYRFDKKNMLLSKILSIILNEKEDAILIDKGSISGVQKDDILLYKNFLVGRIIETYPFYSKAILITDRRCKISVKTKKNVAGVCVGKCEGEIELQFVPHFKEVEIGQLLLSSGKGLMYPQGFALGRIKKIKSDNVLHYISVEPQFDINDFAYVYILKKEYLAS